MLISTPNGDEWKPKPGLDLFYNLTPSLKLTATFTNKGTEPLYQVKAITEADYNVFNDREFIFGKNHNSDASMTHLGGRYIIDEVIRIEAIDEDLARIGRRLDLPLSRAALPHTKENSGTKPAVDKYALFDPDLVEEVLRRQAWVFEHCGYSTRLEDARL